MYVLPDEIIAIIKEYSMPITNPNWKKMHKMPLMTYLNEIEETCIFILINKPLTYANYSRTYLLAKTLFYNADC